MPADDSLAEYRRKRDFEATPEPAGKQAEAEAKGKPGEPGASGRFVVQQHDATRLHWDLRLEGDGVLWSWALPRGIPWDPKRNNLAVHTEDHPLEYLTFEGDIPEGEYGAGHMFVWDEGHYEMLSRKDGKLVVELHGERAQGRHSLFRTGSDRDWMIHRMDPPVDPDRRWPPEFVPPMTAKSGNPRSGDEWVWELRLGGVRAMVTLLTGAVHIHDADGTEISERFVDVRRIGRATGSVEAVLDGMLVGTPQHLERRLQGTPMSARRASESAPVRFVAFDLVWWEGHPQWDEPWEERRALLDSLELSGPAWSASTVHRGDGKDLAIAAEKQAEITGLIGKKRTSPYKPGKTTTNWVDVNLS